MTNPRVSALSYAVAFDKNTIYRSPPPVVFENQLGKFELKDGVLTVWPQGQYRTETEADAAMYSFLKAWEISSALKYGAGTIRFRLSGSTIEDLEPSDPGNIVLHASANSFVRLGDHVDVIVTKGCYPEPPTNFVASAELEIAAHRLFEYEQGRETLTGVAYFVFTLLNAVAGGTTEAAARFNISKAVLKTLSRISSLQGGPRDGRKFLSEPAAPPLTDLERAWLKAALRKVVTRLGQSTSGAINPEITMSDLPPLDV